MGMWLCYSTLGPDGSAMMIFGVLGCFGEKYWKVILLKNDWPQDGEKLQLWEYFESGLKVVGMWLCDRTLGPDGWAMKIFGVLWCLGEKYWKVILVKNEWTWGGENFEFYGFFKVAFKLWECDYMIVLCVLMVQLWRTFEFWVFSIEVLKVILVKNEWPRGGEKFEFWGYFQSCLKVVGMWLCDSTLGPNGGAMKIFGVLRCFREKYWKVILMKMNDRGVGRTFNCGCILKVALRWWECDYVIVLWVVMVELWRSFEFWVVSVRNIEKWFWWKMNDRGVGRNFNLGDIFKVALT